MHLLQNVSLFIWILVFILGYAILFLSAEFLVEEVIEYLEHFKLSPIVFGVIFLGIEIEESSASIFAAANDLPLLSLGNLIGNSIFAITIAFAIPFFFLKPTQQEFPLFYPAIFVILVINLILAMLFPANLFLFSTIAILCFPIVIGYSIRLQKNYKYIEKDEDVEEEGELTGLNLTLRVISGFLLIIIGGQLLVISAKEIIEITNISESFFGLIIMAFVTNGEEFFLMFSTLKKGQYQLGISAQIGKLIWNLSLVFGISGYLIGSIDQTSIFISTSILLLINAVWLFYLIKEKKFSPSKSIFFIIISLIFIIMTFQVL